jgi:hypothetical protein
MKLCYHLYLSEQRRINSEATMRFIVCASLISLVPACATAPDSGLADEETNVSSAEARLGYVSIQQLAPVYSSAGNEYVWEAYLPGVDVTNCTFSWTIDFPEGGTLVLFRQRTWTGGANLQYPGDYYVRVNANCNGEGYGSAGMDVLVSGVGPSTYSPPPQYSNIPSPMAIGSGPISTISNTFCTVWHSYDYETHQYYRQFSSACPGGAQKKPLNASNDG